MKRIDLARDRGSGVFDYQGQNFQCLVGTLRDASRKDLICREDSTQSRCKVELAVPLGLGGEDGLARFYYERGASEMIISMLDVNKFGALIWRSVVKSLEAIATDVGCVRIIFKGNIDSGDVYAGCIPEGAVRRPDGSWVVTID